MRRLEFAYMKAEVALTAVVWYLHSQLDLSKAYDQNLMGPQPQDTGMYRPTMTVLQLVH